ncbi:MAG: acetate--CoA ligase family protein [Deltaproteobacteria bacterium]|nr:acetate--CoA ligase family protein [Deltaproteobacteria bacterium]
MTKIYEYQGKQLLQKAGVKVPEGGVAVTPEESKIIAEKIGRPVVIKAQIWATGRFDAGGVKFADNPDETFQEAGNILGATIKGILVRKVLVEEMLNIEHEYYAAIVVDNSVKIKSPILVFSTEGGTGIEEVAQRNPERVVRHVIDPLAGLVPSDVKAILKKMSVKPETWDKISHTICGLYNAFKENDATSAEINPFVLTKEGDIYAADCHLSIDDNSVFRHPEFEIKVPRDMDREPTDLEQLAWDNIEEGDYRGTGYFAQMITEFKDDETYVGFHGIGGGGSMLGAAALLRRGIKIANYADTSGDPPSSKVYKVIKAIFSQPISAYVITGACLANQEQWYHGFAIVKALKEELKDKPGFPVVILLAGNKEKEAIKIIKHGLKDMDIRLEIYGRDYIYNSDYIGERAETLIAEYLKGHPVEKMVVDQHHDNTAVDKLVFETRCATAVIDYSKCEAAKKNTNNPDCGFACINADKIYDRNILKIDNNRPVLAVSEEAAKKASNESLSWEYACNSTGNYAIEISVDFPGLSDFRKKMN